MTILLPDGASGILLGVARRAIETIAGGGAIDDTWLAAAPILGGDGAAGAFVSLHQRSGHELRGCIGYVPSTWGLVETVARAAEGAASRDPRFPPVRSGEMESLAVDVSVLGAPYAIQPGEVVLGRHGLMIHNGAHHALFLPQVPIEQGWDRETYLDHLCRKAGLAASAWREPGAWLRAFETVVFAES